MSATTTVVLTVPSEDAMMAFLTALNVSGATPELACTSDGGSPFLAGLTEPDADHVRISATEADTGVVHCCECSHPGERGNEWDPNRWQPTYPVRALVTEWPDRERVAAEDYIEVWWAEQEVGARVVVGFDGSITSDSAVFAIGTSDGESQRFFLNRFVAADGALPRPSERPWCRDCGPGYRLGDEGCRHDDHEASEGDTGICRTCALPIWWETGEIGHRERLGWSDRIKAGGDSLVCFKAVGFRHVPMGAREEAIYWAGVKAAAEGRGDR